MISKELLENVLYGESIDNILIISNNVIFEYSHYVNGVFQYRRKTDINIYELANKCKEWAYKQSSHSTGYAIKTVHYGDSVVGGFSGIEESYIDNCKTEHELVFKLCQWILNNKDIK